VKRQRDFRENAFPETTVSEIYIITIKIPCITIIVSMFRTFNPKTAFIGGNFV